MFRDWRNRISIIIIITISPEPGFGSFLSFILFCSSARTFYDAVVRRTIVVVG